MLEKKDEVVQAHLHLLVVFAHNERLGAQARLLVRVYVGGELAAVLVDFAMLFTLLERREKSV